MAFSRERLGRFMDVMRIISALLIFYYHAGIFVALPLSRYGDFAVNTFITLAIVASIAFARGGEAEPSFGSYVWRRVKRIFPLYLLINVAIFGASFVYPSRLGQPFTSRQTILSALGLSIVFGERFLSEVFWFIPFIFQVYMLIGWRGKRLLRLPWPVCFIAAFLISAIEIAALAHFLGEGSYETRKWSPLLRLPELFFGLMTAALISDLISTRAYFVNVATYAVLAIAVACGAIALPIAAYLWMLPLHGLMITILVAIFAALMLLVLDFLTVETSLLRLAGAATFPFFLIHGVGMRFIASRWDSRPLAWASYLLACIIMAVVLTLIFGGWPRKAVSNSASK
ncbi:MAG TPA: acyltransferase family protein [Chthoniobacterales bacterium]